MSQFHSINPPGLLTSVHSSGNWILVGKPYSYSNGPILYSHALSSTGVLFQNPQWLQNQWKNSFKNSFPTHSGMRVEEQETGSGTLKLSFTLRSLQPMWSNSAKVGNMICFFLVTRQLKVDSFCICGDSN